MFLVSSVQVYISNNGRYYEELGYGKHKQGNFIEVKVSDLPKKSYRKLLTRCDVCSKEWMACYANMISSKVHRCFDCTRKYVPLIADYTNTIKATKERVGPKHPRWKEDKDEFKAYSGKVHYLSAKTYVDNEDIINPEGHKRTLCGVQNGYQLDHIFPIRLGFDLGVEPEVLAEVDNLRMLPWEENLARRNNKYIQNRSQRN